MENSTLTGNTLGIDSYSAADLAINGNNIYDNGQGGITLWSSSGITITENRVYRDWVGIALYSVASATLVGNNISLNIEHGVFLADTMGAVLSGNTFTSDGLLIRGTRLEQFESHTITSDNLVNDKPILFFKDQNGLILEGIEAGQLVVVNSQAVQVRRVNLTASGAAIELGFVQQASVQEVVFLASAFGVMMDHSSNVTVQDSFFLGNENGLYATYSQDLQFINNTVLGSAFGISLWFCNRAVVGNNYATLNFNYSIFLRDSPSTVIQGNRVTFSNYGIAVETTGIRVYHNDLIRNNVQATDSVGTGNAWDNGYPSGGNYWSD